MDIQTISENTNQQKQTEEEQSPFDELNASSLNQAMTVVCYEYLNYKQQCVANNYQQPPSQTTGDKFNGVIGSEDIDMNQSSNNSKLCARPFDARSTRTFFETNAGR